MNTEERKRPYLATVFGGYCPRCRQGKLFQNPMAVSIGSNMAMHDRCTVCRQRFELEVGFYYGTGYVSYALALVLTGITFVLWWLLIGFSFEDRRFVTWLVVNGVILILLQPWLMRFSRSLWISWFVKYDPEWATRPPDDPERIVEEQMNNW
jgi:uncharacterized protein (DUF983 family)